MEQAGLQVRASGLHDQSTGHLKQMLFFFCKNSYKVEVFIVWSAEQIANSLTWLLFKRIDTSDFLFCWTYKWHGIIALISIAVYGRKPIDWAPKLAVNHRIYEGEVINYTALMSSIADARDLYT